MGLWSSGPFDLSPDGREAAFVADLGGSMDIWRVREGRPWPEALTADGQMAYELSYSPDGKWLAATRDFEGDENYQIDLIPTKGGPARRVAPAPKARQYLGPWSATSRRLYFSSNRRDERVFDLYRWDLRLTASEMLHRNDRVGESIAMAFDSRERLLFYFVGLTNLAHELWVKDLRSGESRRIFPASWTEAVIRGIHWSTKSGSLWLATDAGEEFCGIARLKSPSWELEWVRRPPCDVDDFVLAPDDSWLAWAENRDGLTHVVVENLKNRKSVKLPWPAGGSLIPAITRGHLRRSRTGRHVAIAWSSPVRPTEIYRADLKTRKVERLTYLQSALAPEASLARPKVHRWKAPDGWDISGYLYLPRSGKPPFKTIVYPHGGPEFQFRAYYNPKVQYYVSQGWAVLAPNFRGSTGFGRRFQKSIYKDWGGACYQDVLAGTRDLISRGVIDPERLAIVGGSFGGYMTLWAATQDPDFWKAAVDIYGVSNLITMIESDPPEWEPYDLEALGDPVKDKDELLRRSPITYVDHLKSPLLVFQGANDFRVKRQESDQMVEALRARGVAVEYVVFEDEGHGWSKTEHLAEELARTVEFLDRHLDRAPGPAPSSPGAAEITLR